jgi:hypothetical protein
MIFVQPVETTARFMFYTPPIYTAIEHFAQPLFSPELDLHPNVGFHSLQIESYVKELPRRLISCGTKASAELDGD